MKWCLLLLCSNLVASPIFHGVDLTTGHFSETCIDHTVDGPQPIDIIRSFHSLDGFWRQMDERIYFQVDKKKRNPCLFVCRSDGTIQKFIPEGNLDFTGYTSKFIPEKGDRTLSFTLSYGRFTSLKNGTTYTYRNFGSSFRKLDGKDRNRKKFREEYGLASIQHPSGITTHYIRDDDNRLIEVRNRSRQGQILNWAKYNGPQKLDQ